MIIPSQVERQPMLRKFAPTLALFIIACIGSLPNSAQSTRETFATGHLLVVYRNGAIPADAAVIAADAGARSIRHLVHFGASTVQIAGDEPTAIARLLRHPEVATVLHDRVVRAHSILFPRQTNIRLLPPNGLFARLPVSLPLAPTTPAPAPAPAPVPAPVPAPAPATDILYDSPQGWAILAAGGFGDNIPGAASIGPWNTTRGAGIRIAILDSGIDRSHPDLVPNLALNLSEIDQTAVPSACDDGSPQDQQGHGTFSASLASAAIGGGNLIGVAPQATLLNIKVLERTPAATGITTTSSTSSSATTISQCEAGDATGLLSWVLLGLEDAIAQHANIVSLSLGTLVDTSTGDGAGWQAQFNAAAYAAQQAGVVVIAALGNDGLNLGSGSLVELPAQARGVLPVVASTNPACAENLAANAICEPGPMTRASYSNFGVAGAIAAPGGSYPQGSTTNGVTGFVRGACSSGLTNTTDGLPGDGHSFGCFGLGHTAYVQAIGTSAAAPLVAGAAAILLGAHPNWTAAQVIEALRNASSTLPNLATPVLNLPAALALP
jgi:subtilisin family serine protease